MGLLVSLELLHLKTEQFTPEDLRVLGGLPALENLILELFDHDFYSLEGGNNEVKSIVPSPSCK
jgi:hypothetical protein